MSPSGSEGARVAVISDVHGNAVALEAVLRELGGERPDVIVVGGDLTWGPLPVATHRLLGPLRDSAIFIRGNAERALLELAAAARDSNVVEMSARERWMVEHHPPELLDFLATFVESAVVRVRGLGRVRFCHGSPRSDEELVTFATPEPRMRALTAGVSETVLVTAHTHIQFDREVAGIRSINPGSVGLAYEGAAGTACWALLGPGVELRRTAFDVDEAVRRYRATDDPGLELMADMLLAPPARDEVVRHAEARRFSG